MDTSKAYNPHWTLETPDRISCVSYGLSGQLLTGSDDGCVRLYQSESPKVSKAIRGLGGEVGSVIFAPRSGKNDSAVWLSVQHKALSFDLDSPKMIITLADAIDTIALGEHEEDALNEISLNHKNNKLAFSTDSGIVGVLDLSTKISSQMKVKHANICGAVTFIPDRPSEIVSGGYDCALIHFDFVQTNVLSRLDFSAPPPESGISLSPPFVLSTAVSSTGIVAAGTADGRIWIGAGGEKRPGSKKKKSRKWEGLKEDEGLSAKVAEGPVIGLAFISPDILISCTLLGTVTRHQVSHSGPDESLELTATWTEDTKSLAKANAIAATEDRIAIAGINKEAKGIVEVWKVPSA